MKIAVKPKKPDDSRYSHTLSIPDSTYAKLQLMAEKTNRSKREIIKMLVEKATV